jgi:hypothetical protein
VVELVVDKLMVASVGGWSGRERKGEKMCKDRGRG